MARRLDWSGMMQAGIRGLGLKPGEFWRLTPAELSLMLGLEPGSAQAPMDRSRLNEMLAQWPDRKQE